MDNNKAVLLPLKNIKIKPKIKEINDKCSLLLSKKIFVEVTIATKKIWPEVFGCILKNLKPDGVVQLSTKIKDIMAKIIDINDICEIDFIKKLYSPWLNSCVIKYRKTEKAKKYFKRPLKAEYLSIEIIKEAKREITTIRKNPHKTIFFLQKLINLFGSFMPSPKKPIKQRNAKISDRLNEKIGLGTLIGKNKEKKKRKRNGLTIIW